MKQLILVVVALWGLLPVAGVAFGQDAANSPATLQEQIDDLRAKIEALEQQLKDAEAEAASQRYATENALGKLVTGAKVKLSGYVQSQFTYDAARSYRTDFDVRRARLKLEAAPTDLASLTLQVDAVPKGVGLKDAYIDIGRAADLWRLRAGKAKTPFMYEVLESSSRRLEPERTMVAKTLFEGERDVGAWLHFNNIAGDSLAGTTLDLGLMDGQGGGDKEDNNNKTIVARLRFVLGREKPDKDKETNTLYIGYLDGKVGVTDKQATGAGISYIAGPLWVRAEYITGQNEDKDVEGWYARVAYPLPSDKDTLFARYDVFDEDTDVRDNDFRNLTVGIEHTLDDKTRVVLAHEFRGPDPGYSDFSKNDGDATTVRLQVKY